MSHESPISSAQAAKMRHKYVVGFVLSIVLTLIPFALVMLDSTASQVVVALLVIAMFAQVWVQLAFFLHLHSDREHRINELGLLRLPASRPPLACLPSQHP